ncbi:cyclase family protein [Pseudonocardia alaniniphila]|uniref:Cyclase family protein n=1 Tax=Pseudonocardia alaniniphila TaxID=75291 RepID=A0ABS9TS06_9PSEU|nr:cyclase family protein [Pseudonocardia alaniniphila]MCH6171339.1 cyclase family protein [Pseudonocardia alaniniphila]
MEDFREIGRRLSNWGRWDVDGRRDERGTTNLLTPERIAAATGLVRDGKVFDLGIPFGPGGPQPGGGRINPVLLFSETGADQNYPGAFHYADDYVFMPLQSASQWDGLAHVFYDDLLYNGFPASDVSPHGAKHLSIENQAKGLVGRGVLVDVARRRGVEWLEAGEVITPEELDATLAAQGTELRGGDIVAVRTGWRRKFLSDGDAASFMAGEPGLGLACCEWLHSHDVAAVCSDNWAIEVLPGEVEGELLPVHMVLIRDMGMTLGEILDFEELSEDCAADGRYEFLLTAPPIKFRRAVGSPINPLAIK